MPPTQPGEARSSLLSRGPCHVYVLPCAYEDFLKLGFSRDPLARLRSLHPRYFEFFDLDRAFLVETETVRDARRIELAWRRELRLHNAPAPLGVRDEAAGHTEWYRGAHAILGRSMRALREAGHRVHDPAAPWVRDRLAAESDRVYAWSEAMFDGMQDLAADPAVRSRLRQTLLDALDAYRVMGVGVDPFVPARVWEWYRQARGLE